MAEYEPFPIGFVTNSKDFVFFNKAADLLNRDSQTTNAGLLPKPASPLIIYRAGVTGTTVRTVLAEGVAVELIFPRFDCTL